MARCFECNISLIFLCVGHVVAMLGGHEDGSYIKTKIDFTYSYGSTFQRTVGIVAIVTFLFVFYVFVKITIMSTHLSLNVSSNSE